MSRQRAPGGRPENEAPLVLPAEFSAETRKVLARILDSEEAALRVERMLLLDLAFSAHQMLHEAGSPLRQDDRLAYRKLAEAAEKMVSALDELDDLQKQNLLVPFDGTWGLDDLRRAVQEGQEKMRHLLSVLPLVRDKAHIHATSRKPSGPRVSLQMRFFAPMLIDVLEEEGIPRSASEASPMVEAVAVIFEELDIRLDPGEFLKRNFGRSTGGCDAREGG